MIDMIKFWFAMGVGKILFAAAFFAALFGGAVAWFFFIAFVVDPIRGWRRRRREAFLAASEAELQAELRREQR